MFPPCKGKYIPCIHKKDKKILLPIVSALALEVIFEVKHETGRFLFFLKMYMEGNQNPSALASIHWMSMANIFMSITALSYTI